MPASFLLDVLLGYFSFDCMNKRFFNKIKKKAKRIKQ